MALIGTHDANNSTLIINGRSITGFDEGEYITIERSVPEKYTTFTGAQGEVTYIKETDDSGMLRVMVQQISGDNAYLDGLYQAETLFTVALYYQNASGLREVMQAVNCRIGTQPQPTQNKEQTAREWVVLLPQVTSKYNS